MRTYTVRAVRPDVRELDVDLVRHGDAGPASRWAGAVAGGDELLVVGPNAAHSGPTRAAAWNPPPGRPFLLLGGDETAVPAVAAILQRLPADARGTAVLEVPAPDDVLGLAAPDGVSVSWQTRGNRPHGQVLDLGLDRRVVAFMGYWKAGRAESS